jgi:signal transduction histidine kinase
VERTLEALLIEDVVRDNRFARDAYWVGVERCSMLAVPILKQGAPQAVLLLENRLSRGAFSTDRLAAVMQIAGQLAVSLDNALLYASLERKVAERTVELEKTHKRLVEASRQTGMAEIATNVLHNVGNVLNSVNVSATLVADGLARSKLPRLSQAVSMIREHEQTLGEFLTRDPRGKHIPAYLTEVSEHLQVNQQESLAELKRLRQNIEHIKEIVAMQQAYARGAQFEEDVSLIELVDDSLRMSLDAVRHEIKVLRQLEPLPPLKLDKHKVLQILMNLLSNARYACVESGHPDPQVTVRLTSTPDRVGISITDNGVGIVAENLTRIFQRGFTTRASGHGFGLHGSALAAKEMGGSLQVHSEGPGRGATFTLELPRV